MMSSREELIIGAETNLEAEAARVTEEELMVHESNAFKVQNINTDDVNLYVIVYTDDAEEKFREIAVKAVKTWNDMDSDKREPVVVYLHNVLRENGIEADIYTRVDFAME